jgi:hypothetical protein
VNQEQRQQASGTGTEEDFEERLRGLLAEDAYTIRPSPAPYPAIRRRGTLERRRRVAVAGVALATLAAVPVGAYALAGGNMGGDVAAPRPSVSAAQRAVSPASPPQSSPSGPARPATEGQLLDGITFEQAAEGLEKCLVDSQQSRIPGAPDLNDLGSAHEYRIILAMNSTGDSNLPGDGQFVVAVKEKPQLARLICRIKDGEAHAMNSSVGITSAPDAGPVQADINGGKLYQQSFLDRGNWKLPFRWGVIGRAEPSVARVTVTYGDATSQAALDHGWFVASDILNRQVTKAPRIKGYDAGGKLVYDSDQDKYHEKKLP